MRDYDFGSVVLVGMALIYQWRGLSEFIADSGMKIISKCDNVMLQFPQIWAFKKLEVIN